MFFDNNDSGDNALLNKNIYALEAKVFFNQMGFTKEKQPANLNSQDNLKGIYYVNEFTKNLAVIICSTEKKLSVNNLSLACKNNITKSVKNSQSNLNDVTKNKYLKTNALTRVIGTQVMFIETTHVRVLECFIKTNMNIIFRVVARA